jgi:hypothetical protein
VPQRVKFDTSSSVPPKVNFGAELRWISKSAAAANVEVLEELPRAEWSCLCMLANDAPASETPTETKSLKGKGIYQHSNWFHDG